MMQNNKAYQIEEVLTATDNTIDWGIKHFDDDSIYAIAYDRQEAIEKGIEIIQTYVTQNTDSRVYGYLKEGVKETSHKVPLDTYVVLYKKQLSLIDGEAFLTTEDLLLGRYWGNIRGERFFNEVFLEQLLGRLKK